MKLPINWCRISAWVQTVSLGSWNFIFATIFGGGIQKTWEMKHPSWATSFLPSDLRLSSPLPSAAAFSVQVQAVIQGRDCYANSKKSPTGPTERTPKPEYPNSSSNLLRGPLVRSHSIFDGQIRGDYFRSHYKDPINPPRSWNVARLFEHCSSENHQTFRTLRMNGQENASCWIACFSRWWFQICFIFHPYLGNIPNLTNIFQRGWNHQLVFNSWCQRKMSLQIFQKLEI